MAESVEVIANIVKLVEFRPQLQNGLEPKEMWLLSFLSRDSNQLKALQIHLCLLYLFMNTGLG